ncbi:MAG: M28 family peptidase, partial [Bacteroidetes bacterium]|nr:M28 family peptidase [Bacteroidota bacterium]
MRSLLPRLSCFALLFVLVLPATAAADDAATAFFDEIALITGELYRTIELAEDGANPRFSPDGQRAAYEHTENGVTVTHVVDVSGSRPVAIDQFEGTDLAFAPDGQSGAYLETTPTDTVRVLAEQLQEARQARDGAAVRRLGRALGWEVARATQLRQRTFGDETSTPVPHDGLLVTAPVYDRQTGTLLVTGMREDQPDHSSIYRLSDDGTALTPVHPEGPGYRVAPVPAANSDLLLYRLASEAPIPVPDDRVERPTQSRERGGQVVLLNTRDGSETIFEGVAPLLSADGSTLAYQTAARDTTRFHIRRLAAPDSSYTVHSTTATVRSPALSPSGRHLAFNQQPVISWQVYLTDTETGDTRQFTRDIQHELFPHFLSDDQLLAKMGEFRHRRSHVYDVTTGTFHRLFHNNTIRTVAMEYEWVPSQAGDRLLIRAERDGNTISEEEGIFLIDLTTRISEDTLRDRIAEQLAAERALRADAETMFAPIRQRVETATAKVNITRLYEHQKALYDFDSKYYTQPGNQKASTYISETLASFGYEPELQWFMPNGRDSTANVVARLEGSTHPEVVYIYSAHFDSVLGSPGADDNSTGTAILLEMARVLKDEELPATIIFASLTAEEAGLLGAREFVRRADEEGLQVAGVVNNDMMGWTRHHRLDNTIRFSNYGIRDIQHASAHLFSDLITYDSRYYRFTDAHVFFDAYGDVLGGIGSYPILGNPNYHQPTDRLETINHHLVRAVAQATAGVFIKLAHTPSMIRGLERADDTVTWEEPLETDITHYEVRVRHATGETEVFETEERSFTHAALPDANAIEVRA